MHSEGPSPQDVEFERFEDAFSFVASCDGLGGAVRWVVDLGGVCRAEWRGSRVGGGEFALRTHTDNHLLG